MPFLKPKPQPKRSYTPNKEPHEFKATLPITLQIGEQIIRNEVVNKMAANLLKVHQEILTKRKEPNARLNERLNNKIKTLTLYKAKINKTISNLTKNTK